MSFTVVFIALSLINVIFSTVRSIATIKSGKTLASILSGGYYAFYNIMLIYTVADFPMWQKCLITFGCNLIGVFVVKLIEEKMQKDKLWKVEATFEKDSVADVCRFLSLAKIPYNVVETNGKYAIVNSYCATQKQSSAVKEILNQYNAKYFVSESKVL